MEHFDTPALLLLLFTLFFWRVSVAVAVAMFTAWLVSKATTANTAYLSYAMLGGSLILGIIWEVKVRRSRRRLIARENRSV